MYKYGYCLHAALLHVPQVRFMSICYHPYYNFTEFRNGNDIISLFVVSQSSIEIPLRRHHFSLRPK